MKKRLLPKGGAGTAANRAATASAPRTAARPRRVCGRALPGKENVPSLPSGNHLDTVRDISVGLALPLEHSGQLALDSRCSDAVIWMGVCVVPVCYWTPGTLQVLFPGVTYVCSHYFHEQWHARGFHTKSWDIFHTCMAFSMGVGLFYLLLLWASLWS